MKRILYQSLLKWKESKDRKPLIIKGARQVGKTWLMQHFGKNEYKNFVYVNFEASKHLQGIFESNFDTDRILQAVQIETGSSISADDTLLIFDEIQEAKGGVTALKYFHEEKPSYHIVAAGSYLGINIHSQYSFPVGKVQFLDLFPMNFIEFLWATGNDGLVNIIKQKDMNALQIFKTKLTGILKKYYVVGGMPEVVKNFVESENLLKVRQIQADILQAYEYDFGKHVPARQIPRIKMIWDFIPVQLSKENKKFIFGLLKKGARAKEFETALTWLEESGLIRKIYRIKKPGFPIRSYADSSAFKIFFVDIGLLGALSDLDPKIILQGDTIFKEFKGALTEQYVFQQLNPCFLLYYWSSERSDGEIDFIIQKQQKIIPIEVKAEENLKAKSLKSFCKKYEITNAFRFSLSDYRVEEWMENIPLYAIENVCPDDYQ